MLQIKQTTKFQSISATAITFTLDESPSVGDLLVAFCCNVTEDSGTVTAPDESWSKINELDESNVNATVWYKIVESGDGQEYIFNKSGVSSNCSGVLYNISGHNVINPIHQSDIIQGTSSPSLTPTILGTLALAGLFTSFTNAIGPVSSGWSINEQQDMAGAYSVGASRDELTSDIITEIYTVFDGNYNHPMSCTILINTSTEDVEGVSNIKIIQISEEQIDPFEVGISNIKISQVSEEEVSIILTEIGVSNIKINQLSSEFISLQEVGISNIKINPISEEYIESLVDLSKTFLTHIGFLKQTDIIKNSYNTDIRFTKSIENLYNTDIRFSDSVYSQITPGSVSDFVIKLDGTSLEDVDLSTANIQFNLNSTPSVVNLTLTRHHDKYNYTLDNVLSVIDNNNKIQIYDKDVLLFTGYITEIEADSVRDLVHIKAEDKRYELLIKAPATTFSYGYNQTYSNSRSALQYILSSISSIINGYDSSILNYVDVQLEEKSLLTNYAKIIDTIIHDSATIDWYLDENEKLQYSVRDTGNAKNLNLSSIDKKRHVYDTILSNVSLNIKTSEYVTGYTIVFPDTRRVAYWSNKADLHSYRFAYDAWKRTNNDKLLATFQTWWGRFVGRYVGLNQNLYSYNTLYNTPVYWMWWIAQIKTFDGYIATPSVNIGTSVNREIYNSSYNLQNPYSYLFEENERLKRYYSDSWNHTAYGIDEANFNLHQNNKLKTTANVSLLLNAFKYYNLSFKDRINLDNNLQVDIYKDNNGFPLNINNYTLSLNNRVVTLNLTNHGGNYFRRTVNYGSGIYSKAHSTVGLIKYPIVRY